MRVYVCVYALAWGGADSAGPVGMALEAGGGRDVYFWQDAFFWQDIRVGVRFRYTLKGSCKHGMQLGLGVGPRRAGDISALRVGCELGDRVCDCGWAWHIVAPRAYVCGLRVGWFGINFPSGAHVVCVCVCVRDCLCVCVCVWVCVCVCVCVCE